MSCINVIRNSKTTMLVPVVQCVNQVTRFCERDSRQKYVTFCVRLGVILIRYAFYSISRTVVISYTYLHILTILLTTSDRLGKWRCGCHFQPTGTPPYIQWCRWNGRATCLSTGCRHWLALSIEDTCFLQQCVLFKKQMTWIRWQIYKNA